MAVCPLIAALSLVYREHKVKDMQQLLRRAFDYKRIRAPIWYGPIIFLSPIIVISTYGLMRVMELPLPILQFPVLAAPVMLLAFFIFALGEELGWSGYVIDPMQDRGMRSKPAFSWG